jgi:hypothetical protein
MPSRKCLFEIDYLKSLLRVVRKIDKNKWPVAGKDAADKADRASRPFGAAMLASYVPHSRTCGRCV